MKTLSIILTISLIGLNLLGQKTNQDYHPTSYPTFEYEIDSIERMHEGFKVVLIIVRRIHNPDTMVGSKVWLQQFELGKKVSEKYLGEIDSEYGFYTPNPQPINKYFILVECWECHGVLHLIDKDGLWVDLPGYYFAFDQEKNLLLTQNLEGVSNEYEVSKIDLTTMAIEIKMWKKGSDSDPWDENQKFYQVADTDWIR